MSRPALFHAAAPLLLGLEPEAYAEPFAAALATLPELDVVRAPRGQLREQLQHGRLDCALLPPVLALQVPMMRLAPGAGIAGVPTEDAPLPPALECAEWTRLMRAMPDCPLADAVGLARHWEASTGLPPVWMVWACRFRAPYPCIRNALWQMQRLVENTTNAECHGASGLRGTIASLEADSLRRLAQLGHQQGLFPECPAIEFC